MKFAVEKVKGQKINGKITGRDEPPWHDSRIFLKLEELVGASNLTQVHAAFGTRSSFVSFLPVVRNFYAHRCQETNLKAARVGIKLGLSAKPEMRATRILCSKLPRRPENVLTDWLDDMSNVIELLCV